MKTGDVVMSLMGHDKERLYVIVGLKDGKVLLCDGKIRKLANPKPKNKRHLKETGKKIILSSYNPLYDAHIRKELKSIKKCVDKTFVNN